MNRKESIELSAKDTLKYNNRRVEHLCDKLDKYKSDIKKDERVKKQLCRYCFYMESDKIVMNAFTPQVCKECGEQSFSANSDIDKYCSACAKKYNVCKHCGSYID